MGASGHCSAARCSLVAATDITNPLLGPHGAAEVYPRQKGADDAGVVLGVRHTAILADHFTDPMTDAFEKVVDVSISLARRLGHGRAGLGDDGP